MRGIGAAARRGASQFPSYAAAFSSFSGVGGGGAGRGRGSGSGTGPSQFGQQPRAPGRPIPDDDGGGADPFSTPASVGRGRGEPVAPYSSSPPSFSALSGAGRGRGSPPAVEDAPKQRVTKRTEDDAPTADPERPRPDAFPSALPRPAPTTGAGRGAPRFQQPSAGTATEENRFVRRREAKQAAAPSSAPSTQPKLSAQDAVKRALELLGGGEGEDGGRGEGGRGDRGRGGGRGGRSGRDRRRVDRTGDEADGRHMIYLGENADGEKLEKRLGADKMKVLEKAFDEAADNTLPHPMEDAYMDACHTNNMIEFEPEYHVNFENPDIDEKAPMSLEEMLQKVKPFIVAYEGIKDQEEWEEAVKDVMKRAPHMKELIDMYSGPDVVTAKQQEEELQRVANTLPENIPSSVNRFTDKMLLSLKNNPGWGFDKKCQFMDKFAREVSELYK